MPQGIPNPILSAIQQFFERLIEALNPPLVVKIISGFFSVFLFVLVVILSIKANRLWRLKLIRESIRVANFPKEFDKKWQLVLTRMKRADEANLKLAVIEADKLLDSILIHMGYKGKDMSERLQQVGPAQLSCLDDVWLAHKVRDRIVKEPDHHLSTAEAQSAIAAYEKAFKELQLL